MSSNRHQLRRQSTAESASNEFEPNPVRAVSKSGGRTQLTSNPLSSQSATRSPIASRSDASSIARRAESSASTTTSPAAGRHLSAVTRQRLASRGATTDTSAPAPATAGRARLSSTPNRSAAQIARKRVESTPSASPARARLASLSAARSNKVVQSVAASKPDPRVTSSERSEPATTPRPRQTNSTAPTPSKRSSSSSGAVARRPQTRERTVSSGSQANAQRKSVIGVHTDIGDPTAGKGPVRDTARTRFSSIKGPLRPVEEKPSAGSDRRPATNSKMSYGLPGSRRSSNGGPREMGPPQSTSAHRLASGGPSGSDRSGESSPH